MITPMAMPILRVPYMQVLHTTTKITTTIRKRFAYLRALHNIPTYPSSI
jgi:hypothetical protein